MTGQAPDRPDVATASPTGSHEPGTRTVRSRFWRPRHVVRTSLVVIVAALTASAGAAFYLERPFSTAPAAYSVPPAGWATFDTAWNDVAESLAGFANGSWTISFAEGVAADEPWSPPASYYGTVWSSCETQLSGISTLTFWNASEYPASQSPDDFSSGSAPLWTFIFNGTGTQTFVVTWLLDKIILNGAVESGSPCFDTGLFTDYGRPINPALWLDSSVIAGEVDQANAAALTAPSGTSEALPVPPAPGAALYFPGTQAFAGGWGGPPEWSFVYSTCGLEDRYGNSAFFAYTPSATTRGPTAPMIAGTFPCYRTDYLVQLSATPGFQPQDRDGAYFEWEANVSFLTSAVPAMWNLTDLSTSLFGLSLTYNSSLFGEEPPSIAAECGPGSTGLSSCPIPDSGWYGVLLSRNGTWLDSFPASPNGTRWTVTGVPLASQDVFALLGPYQEIGPLETFDLTSGNNPVVFGGASVP